MKFISRIQLEDGPEDGRVLTRRMLDELCAEQGDLTDDISLYTDGSPSSRTRMPVLLGRYSLGKIERGIATYRWRPA